MKHVCVLSTTFVFILIYALAVFSSPVVAAGTTVGINSITTVSQGDDFTASLTIADVIDFDAAQYDITYDPSVIEVTGVTNGLIGTEAIPVVHSDYIPPGILGKIRVINNVPNVPGVTGSGYLAIIHFHVVGAAGASSPISLSGGILGDKDAQEIPATWTGATVQVSADSGGGDGGGGGGGGVVGEKRFTQLMSVTDQDLRLLEDVEALSVDLKVGLFIKKGTVVKNKFASILTSIVVEKLVTPPDKPLEAEIIGSAFDISPNGAKFEPPALLTIKYDEEWLPEGILEDNLYIAIWNEVNHEWERIECTVDPDKNIITAYLNHLSIYTIMAGTRPANLELNELTVDPVEVGIGEDVTISVLVTNTGDLTGSYGVSLKIDNEVKQIRMVKLDGHGTQSVSFNVRSIPAGEHTVSVNDLSATFVVEDVSTAPEPIDGAVATVTPEPEPTPVQTTAPALATEPARPASPAPVGELPSIDQSTKNGMPVVFGAIGGAVIVFILVSLYIRRRRD